MGKERKRIPAALHSELNEYSSLLRVLWTEDTQDVASQLARHTGNAPIGKATSEEDLYEDDVGLSDSDIPVDNSATQDSGSHPHPKKRRKQQLDTEIAVKRRKMRLHSLWVRWPIPLEDTPVPEWGFPDQMRLVLQIWLTQQPLRVPLAFDAHTPQIPPIIGRLSESSEWVLSSLLGTITSLMPRRALSAQNRIDVCSWQNVLAMLVLRCHTLMLTPDLLDAVQTKMAHYVAAYQDHKKLKRPPKATDPTSQLPLRAQRAMQLSREEGFKGTSFSWENLLFHVVPVPPRKAKPKKRGTGGRPRRQK